MKATSPLHIKTFIAAITLLLSIPASASPSITVKPSNAALVPAERKNCTDLSYNTGLKSTPAYSVGYSTVTLEWLEPYRDLYIAEVSLHVPLLSTLSETVIRITDPVEIDALFGITNQKVPRFGKGTIDGLYSTSSDNKPNNASVCPLAFGGLEVLEDGITLEFSATVQISGYSTDDQIHQQPETVSAAVQILIAN